MKDIRKHAQTVWELRHRSSKKHESDARVLGIQTADNTGLTLEGNEVPSTKAVARVGHHGRQPPRQQGGRQSQGGERFGKPKQRHFHQQKGGPDKNAKRGNKFNEAAQGHSKEDRLKSEMRDWIQTCLKEAVQKLDLPSQQGHGPSKGPDPKSPTA